MKIDSYAIQMNSSRIYQESLYRKSEWTVEVGAQQVRTDIPNGVGVFLEISDGALRLQDTSSGTEALPEERSASMFQLSDKDKLKIRMLERMLSFMLGKEVKFQIPKESEDECRSGSADRGSNERLALRFRMSFQFYERHELREHTAFSAAGIVRTSDGRELAFTHSFAFEREVVTETSLQWSVGNWQDPLVLHFDGPASALSGKTFEFDFYSDGTLQSIPQLHAGQGFLALDRDGSGTIDNGKELFGPSTGNGFAELAEFDDDGNGWIDENDSIFDRLEIWTKTEDGMDQRFGLLDKDVGAIFLGHVNTEYLMEERAKLRTSGVYLKESGGSGSIHMIDFKL